MAVSGQISELDVAFNTIEMAGIIQEARSMRDEMVHTPTSNLGVLSDLVAEKPIWMGIFGESLAGGIVDRGWGWKPPAESFEIIFNRLLATIGVPEPRYKVANQSTYMISSNYSRGGMTMAAIKRSIDDFGGHVRGSTQPTPARILTLGAGGNNALELLNHIHNLKDVSFLAHNFRTEFVPSFREQYTNLVRSLLDLPMQGVRQINLTGLPNISNSAELSGMKLPGIHQIVESVCVILNYQMYKAAQLLQSSTSANICYIDTFSSITNGRSIPIKRIHPTAPGYKEIGDNIAAATYAQFPDGAYDSIHSQAKLHGILSS